MQSHFSRRTGPAEPPIQSGVGAGFAQISHDVLGVDTKGPPYRAIVQCAKQCVGHAEGQHG